MKEQIKTAFTGYLIYFFISSFLSFICGYFIFSPWVHKLIEIDDKNFYIILKKERINIKNEEARDILNKKISIYELRLEELKLKIDDELEYKKTVLKDGSSYGSETEICLNIKEFVKNSFLLEKYQLSEKYSKIQQHELTYCN